VPELSRRDVIVCSTALAALRSLHAAVKPVRITDVELFRIEIPVRPAEAEAGVNHRFTVAKVVTDAGVNGYSFAGPPARVLPEVKQVLVGKDLFSIDQHLKNGLGRWGGVGARDLGRHRTHRRTARVQAAGRTSRSGEGLHHVRLEALVQTPQN